MLSSKQGPIIPKKIYKSEPAFSNCKVEWIMSLLGIMIFIGYQSEMGSEKYAWKKEGSLYNPAFIYPSRHCIPESANSIYSITTRYLLSTTVINYDDVQYSDANMFWKNQYPTKNDMGDHADTFRRHPTTDQQRCNVEDDTMDSCGRPAKTMSKPGNLNADQWLRGGTGLPQQETFVPLEHNLLRMMAHVVFAATADAFADTKHNKNQDNQSKACIAHTAFASNKANRKTEEEPKHLPGLETSTRHYSNAASDVNLISMEKKVEYALNVKSELMMLMPDIRLKLIFGSSSYLVWSVFPNRTKYIETYLRDAQEVPNDELVSTSSSLSCKTLQPYSASASMETGLPRPFRSGVMNLNRGSRRDCMSHGNRAPTANEEYDTSGRNSLRLPQRSTTSMLPTLRPIDSLSNVVTTKSPWERDHFGFSMPRPSSYEEDIDLAKMMHDPMMPLDDDRLSTTSSKIPLVNHAQYIPLGDDAQYDKMSELRRSPHHVHPVQLLSEYRKHLEHFEFDQGNKEDDRVEHIHETNLTEDLGQELNDDRPPNAAKADVLDPVYNGPPRTRCTARLDSYNYPLPVFADDEGGAGSLADPKNDMPQNDEPVEDRSIQVPTILPSKTPKRSMSATPRATIPRVPRSGTSAPTAGEASGTTYDLRKPRPSNATEVNDVWPPLSAPCAIHYDQHGDTSTTATTSSRGVSDDFPSMCAATS